MKKLLLVTGIFLSLGMMASAQQKKSTAPATPLTQQTKETKKAKLTREQQLAKKKALHAKKAVNPAAVDAKPAN
ncbi:MAG: hypothetical protein QM737_16580 [Ferruginibacter sp.]